MMDREGLGGRGREGKLSGWLVNELGEYRARHACHEAPVITFTGVI